MSYTIHKGKEIKTISNKDALTMFGLRREGGEPKFSPQRIAQAVKKHPDLLTGAVVLKYNPVIRQVARPGTCVIRLGGLGDLVLLSSTLEKLKRKSPGTPLILATANANRQVLNGLFVVDDCISIEDLNRFKFDRVIDLRYAVEPDRIAPGKGKTSWKDYISMDRSDIFDRLCGVRRHGKHFQIPVSDRKRDEMRKLAGTGRVIGLVPSSYAIHRSIPPDYIKTLAGMLIGHGFHVALFGKTEKWDRHLKALKMPGMVNLLDRTDIRQAVALCSILDLLITPDSGFLHVAGALKVKCLGVFGNIDPKTRVSYYPTVKTIYAKQERILGCVPCWDLHPGCKPFRSSAPCMRLLKPELIFEAARGMLDA